MTDPAKPHLDLYIDLRLRYLRAKRDFPNLNHDDHGPKLETLGLHTMPITIEAIEQRMKREFERKF